MEKVVLPSASVAGLAENPSLSSPDGVTSYAVLRTFVESQASALNLDLGDEPEGAKLKLAAEWIKEAGDVYDLSETELLDGRRLIFALGLLDEGLFLRLSENDFLRNLEDELTQSGLRLSRKGRRLLARRRPARLTIPILHDAPAESDELERAILARVLAGRIRRARGQSVPTLRRWSVWAFVARGTSLWRSPTVGQRSLPAEAAAAPPLTRAVIFHIDGPWGSGKSSLLNFVAGLLRSPQLPKEERWVVVTFNAWKHQRFAPPWWWLTATLQDGAVRELRSISRYRALRLRLLGSWWRLRDVWAAYVVLGTAAVAAFFLWRAGFFGSDISSFSEAVEALAKIGAFAALIWGAARALGRWVVAGPGGASSAVLERSRDPLGLVRRRFSRTVRAIGSPVAIFIDDLDRCVDTYIVELLEGIQTLFIDEPVVIVVSADGKWLSDAYKQVYRELAATAGEPGRPLGSLFLDKAFQHTVRLARIPDDVRERYWQRLLGSERDGRSSDAEEHRRAESIFEPLASAEDILTRLREEEAKGDVDSYALHLAASRALGGRAVEERNRHMLDHFSGLLEDNPRAIKKLLNAYGIELELRLPDLPGDEQTLRQLALWTILTLRWPLLAEYLAVHPDDISYIGNAAGEKPEDLPDELAPLLRRAAVRNVVHGGNVTPAVALDADAITLFVGARGSRR